MADNDLRTQLENLNVPDPAMKTFFGSVIDQLSAQEEAITEIENSLEDNEDDEDDDESELEDAAVSDIPS